MKQPINEIDLRFGFPGQLPQAGRGDSTERLLKFFEHYVRLGDARRAALEAGYAKSWAKNRSYAVLKQHADYVTWLQAHVAQQTAKAIAIDQRTVVEEIARIALANEFDFLAFEKVGAKVLVRRKRLDELTREQMVAIKVLGDGEKLTYRLRDRDSKLFELGKHLGLFNEKILLEHRHSHLHVNFDLSKVNMKDLEALEGQFAALLGENASDVPQK